MNQHRTHVCAELEAYLSEYIDGEAKESICRTIEEHLASCDNCRIVIDTIRKTIALYHSAPSEPVPNSVHDRLITVLNLSDF
jgi:anti-sigma factor RsiW